MVLQDTVLVIDDDDELRLALREALTDSGFNVETARNGDEGLKIALQIKPNIILLDLVMPIMDGWQFLEEFIGLPMEKSVRINIVTSSIDPVDLQNWEYYKGKTHHLIDFINKPIRLKDIAEITKAA